MRRRSPRARSRDEPPARPLGGAAAAEESESLRRIARQMAAVADSGALLRILCDAASEQCDATTAAVVKVQGDQGIAVTAVGSLALAEGRRFPLRGSLVREVLVSRDVVGVADFSARERPIATVVPEVRIGPLLAAPLVAHESILGVLVVGRGAGEPVFSGAQTERLRAIADHAALAMWKADLLDKAQAADRAKGRFLATISHELRTPLTALTGYEELLADEVLGPLTESQRDVLERMRSVTGHLSAMIEEVLTFSSLEDGREVVRPVDFLAADLVRAAAAVTEPLARQKGLTLLVSLPEQPIRMSSDIDKVRQILVNLTGNAVKFTEQGEVRLTLEPREGEVAFGVHDTGVGLDPGDIRQLFRPFTQLDAGLTRRHGGTGLGLYISQRLARLLGGRIEVHAELGVGASFCLLLPREIPGS